MSEKQVSYCPSCQHDHVPTPPDAVAPGVPVGGPASVVQAEVAADLSVRHPFGQRGEPVTRLIIRPCRRDEARAFVREHHSHHRGKTAAADCFRLAAELGGRVVAVAIMGEATAPAFGGQLTWEVTRLCCGPLAPKYTASRLLGACGRVMDAAGVQLSVSYTRVDERGSSYLAANWIAVAYRRGEAHDHGNRRGRASYKPSTEIVDRVRWERGPRAPTRAPEVEWTGERWVRLASRAA